MAENKDKFFFEEDPKADESGLTWEEHGQTFFNILETEGVKKEAQSMAPMQPEIDAGPMKILENRVLKIEAGVFRENYAIHVTPTHPQRNLQDPAALKRAIKLTIENLNQAIPFDLQVQIALPQPDWEIKATSYTIVGGATAWNLDIKRLEDEILPVILKEVTAICMKP